MYGGYRLKNAQCAFGVSVTAEDYPGTSLKGLSDGTYKPGVLWGDGCRIKQVLRPRRHGNMSPVKV